jgi:conjugative relaxase-like TrwC/TraI family protein
VPKQSERGDDAAEPDPGLLGGGCRGVLHPVPDRRSRRGTGTWGGAQAAALGLSGEVTNDDLLALLQGLDSVSGAQLGRPFHDRHFADGRVERAVAGFDLTFSAPKSPTAIAESAT